MAGPYDWDFAGGAGGLMARPYGWILRASQGSPLQMLDWAGLEG